METDNINGKYKDREKERELKGKGEEEEMAKGMGEKRTARKDDDLKVKRMGWMRKGKKTTDGKK